MRILVMVLILFFVSACSEAPVTPTQSAPVWISYCSHEQAVEFPIPGAMKLFNNSLEIARVTEGELRVTGRGYNEIYPLRDNLQMPKQLATTRTRLIEMKKSCGCKSF